MTDLEKKESPEEDSNEVTEETASELVEERLEKEGELSAASAEKEFAGLTKEESSKSTGGEEKSEEEAGEEGQEEAPRARGLYRYIHISLPTLNKLIVVLCIALVLCLLYGMQNRGYMIDFDSMGGTPVESEKLMYSDKVIPPEPPYREGYDFTGWYTNADCTQLWNMEEALISGPMTLYAGWEKKDE